MNTDCIVRCFWQPYGGAGFRETLSNPKWTIPALIAGICSPLSKAMGTADAWDRLPPDHIQRLFVAVRIDNIIEAMDLPYWFDGPPYFQRVAMAELDWNDQILRTIHTNQSIHTAVRQWVRSHLTIVARGDVERQRKQFLFPEAPLGAYWPFRDEQHWLRRHQLYA